MDDVVLMQSSNAPCNLHTACWDQHPHQMTSPPELSQVHQCMLEHQTCCIAYLLHLQQVAHIRVRVTLQLTVNL